VKASSAFGPLARILVVLAVAHFPWPGLPTLFCCYFSATTAKMLDSFAERGVALQLGPAAPPAPPWRVTVIAANESTAQGAKAELDVRRVGWLPFGAFSALLLAFPVRRWKRRLAVAAAGLCFLHALWLLPVLASFGSARGGFFALGTLGHGLVVVAQRALQTLPGMAYALPALLWFVLTWSLERELM